MITMIFTYIRLREYRRYDWNYYALRAYRQNFTIDNRI